MKRFFLILVILVSASTLLVSEPSSSKKSTAGKRTVKQGTRSSDAENQPFKAPYSAYGLGVFLGQPIGITFGMDLSPTSLLDFKAAWDFSGVDGTRFAMLFQGNYQFTLPGSFVIQRHDIVPFFGLGAELGLGSDGVKLGLRIPLGLDYRFVSVPLELFLEAGIGMYVFPKTELSWGGGLGVRYRFR